MKKVKIMFLIIYMLISCSFLLLVFVGQKEVIFSENRSAQKIPYFSFSKFINNKFQNELESALSDQFFKGEGLKKLLLVSKNKIFSFFPKGNTKNEYYKITSDFYGFDNSEYMLYTAFSEEFVDSEKDSFKAVATPYNEVQNVDKYFYFINTDQTINFKNPNYNIYMKIKELYPTFKSDYLKVDGFETYKEWFYKTDHHWNYKGANQGYKDIINLMLGEKEPILVPDDEITFDTIFYGSRANKAKYYNYKEKFTVYSYNVPKHKTYINGIEQEYGNKSGYHNNTYKYDNNTNHNGQYYGWDYAEIVYDFNRPHKENLLIISGSFSNAINELIASHFNKTYIIDLRHYKDFDVDEYIEKNKIDKFIFITYISHCKGTEFLMGGNK